jgi:hypothetical protein
MPTTLSDSRCGVHTTSHDVSARTIRRATGLVAVLVAGCASISPRDDAAPDAGSTVDTRPDPALVGGSGGGGTTAPDAAPPPAVDWPELAFSYRVLLNLPVSGPMLCGEGDRCPDGQRCFRLTQEVALCDVPEREQATTCEIVADAGVDDASHDCACPGMGCRPDQRCVASQVTCSCPPKTVHRCVDAPCSSPSDCPSGSVCRPPSFIFENGDPLPSDGTDDRGRCVAAGCQSDADCTLVAGGRCGVFVTYPQQGGSPRISISCLYAQRVGACPAGASLIIGGFPQVCVPD